MIAGKKLVLVIRVFNICFCRFKVKVFAEIPAYPGPDTPMNLINNKNEKKAMVNIISDTTFDFTALAHDTSRLHLKFQIRKNIKAGSIRMQASLFKAAKIAKIINSAFNKFCINRFSKKIEAHRKAEAIKSVDVVSGVSNRA